MKSFDNPPEGYVNANDLFPEREAAFRERDFQRGLARMKAIADRNHAELQQMNNTGVVILNVEAAVPLGTVVICSGVPCLALIQKQGNSYLFLHGPGVRRLPS